MGRADSMVSPQGTHMTDIIISPAVAAPVAAGAGGIALAALIPGVDTSAVICGFAGALIMVIANKDLSALERIGYLVSSWIFGYFAAIEWSSRLIADSPGLTAFMGGLLCVAISMSLLEWVKSGKIPVWFAFLRRGGKP